MTQTVKKAAKKAVVKEKSGKAEPIPYWIIKYDAANYQSSAGKAVRYLINRLQAQRNKTL